MRLMSDSRPPVLRAHDAAAVRAALAKARAGGLRARAAAAALGLSEGQVIAAHAGVGPDAASPAALRALRLTGSPWPWLTALAACGPVLALVRNALAIHEKVGVLDLHPLRAGANPAGTGVPSLPQPGLDHAVTDDHTDTDMAWADGQGEGRWRVAHWHAAYAVWGWAANPGNRSAPGIVVFDAAGEAVLKLFVREATCLAAWQSLIERHAHVGAGPQTVFKGHAGALPAGQAPGAAPDWAAQALGQGWPVRLAGRGRALPVAALASVLAAAAFDAMPVCLCVGHASGWQAHRGLVHQVVPRVVRGQHWLNVTDPDFTLHLWQDQVARLWWIPGARDEGNALLALAADGSPVLTLSGRVSAAAGEPEDWANWLQAQLAQAR